MTHKFKEYRFDPDGEINGFRCCVQEYKCEHCKVIIELPMGVKPSDYSHDECKGGQNVARTNCNNVFEKELSHNNNVCGYNGHRPNRHELRRMRSIEIMQLEENYRGIR